MPNELKLFGAKATASFSSRFKFSLWKLTAMYVAILAVILFLSSSILYSAFSSQLGHRFGTVRPIPDEFIMIITPPPSREDVEADLIKSLLVVNGFLLLTAGIASYWLAKLTLRPINDAYERQRKFLGDASHELRTPLAILRTDLENELANNSVKGLTRERAQSNLEEVERMSRLVSDLLMLSNSDENGLVMRKNFTMVNLSALIKTTADRLQSLAKEHSVSLNFTLAAGNPITIFSDEDLLLHAITNVVKNGILYNKPNGSVTITLAESGNFVIIDIADTGIGISSEDLSKIFDRFYRSDKSRSRQTGGSGLGLSIVRSSIEQVGGTVVINSELEKGTTVTLRLPRK